ncbi:MAG: AbrB family transcriptional regulator [Pseudaminobacter sp.]|nr:AbrB family transcriptional regulator [Pseudaminobacter sp.]
MARLRKTLLVAATLCAAALGGSAFQALGLPLAWILGSLAGSAIIANLAAPMKGGRFLRRGGQLFVGASIGAVLGPDVVAELLRLLPLMAGVALASILIGLALALPVAKIAGIDRLSAVLSCLPAGMAEMATLARELDANEQAVAIIHTLRVIMVLTLIPLWLGLTAGVVVPGPPPNGYGGVWEIFALAAVAGIAAAVATKLRVTNAWILAPMLLSLAVVSGGHGLPPVPAPLLVLAQIAIGASLGLRFRLDQMQRFPRIALAGLVSGLLLIGAAFIGLASVVEALTGLDHISAILAVAPGGLGEMIASATTLGLLAATVAGYQMTRSLMTNLLAPPLIRWFVGQSGGNP